MSKPNITHLAWIDIETTGLDKSRDPILEIAMILTPVDDLDTVVATYERVINPGPGVLKSRLDENEYVRDMHTKNGLLDEIKKGNCTSVDAAEFDINFILAKHVKVPSAAMIAGSGVAQFDQQVLRLQMPQIDNWFAYYPMDTGVIRRFIKHVVKRHDLLLPETKSSHRAMADVEHALREARHYREYFELNIAHKGE